MKLYALRSAAILALAALLAACGGGQVDQSGGNAKVIAAAMPAPDCAADGCTSLRVIDGNAEAYRYDAMRRAAAEAAGASS